MLLLSVLAQVSLNIKKKLLKQANKYNFKFEIHHALAIHIIYRDYLEGHSYTTQVGNMLHSMNNQIMQALNI
jgi:hypothetical protein